MLTIIVVNNVYAYFGFGTRDGATLSNPLAKLLPLTTVAEGHQDWVDAYNKWTQSSSQSTSNPSSVSTPSNPSSSETNPLPSASGSDKIAGAVENNTSKDVPVRPLTPPRLGVTSLT